MIGLSFSCHKEIPKTEQQNRDNQDNDLQQIDANINELDTIYSELGDYAQLDLNNYWKYKNEIISYLDYPPFTEETTLVLFKETLVGDTIINNRQFYIKNDGSLYHYSEGEYYNAGCSDKTKCLFLNI